MGSPAGVVEAAVEILAVRNPAVPSHQDEPVLGPGETVDDLIDVGSPVTVERGCARFEWSVLDWNEPAIAFYRKLGAVPMDDWTVQRVSGDALLALAASHEQAEVCR